MKISALRNMAAAGIMILTVAFICCACQGRTADNVQPTGETVEVVIASPERETVVVDTLTPESPAQSEINMPE